LSGQVAALYLVQAASSLRSGPVEMVEATLEGFVGDTHTGATRKADARAPWHPKGTVIANDRQVSLVSEEELATIAERLEAPEIRPEWLGANVCIRGVEGFSTLPPMTRLQFSGGVTLAITAENHPCRGPAREVAASLGRDDIASRFVKQAMHLRGVVAMVERAGRIQAGETVIVVTPQ